MPNINEWMTRDFGRLNYHMTQILTGHGSFGTYLRRINKRESALCPHCIECNNLEDSAEHTLLVCDAWCVQRTELRNVIGQFNTLEELVSAILIDLDKWNAFSSFANRVMRIKEEAERAIERRRGALPPAAGVGNGL